MLCVGGEGAREGEEDQRHLGLQQHQQVHTYIHAYIHTHSAINIVRTMHTCIYINTLYTYMHIFMHIYIHIHTYILYIHMYIHLYIYTHSVLKPFSAPDFSVISKFVLDTELAAYVLTIELQVESPNLT